MQDSTSITANTQNLTILLGLGQQQKFVIPEYQRPYAWEEEQARTLFEDIWEFSQTTRGDNTCKYFLGSIVTFQNEDGEQEIIDGQQRLTSLLLLLRAIYTRLQEGIDCESVSSENLVRDIKRLIWSVENRHTGEVDTKCPLLYSRSINDKERQVFKQILETGKTQPHAKDKFSTNYNLFLDLYDEKRKGINVDNGLIYDFICALLDQVILLPITVNSQESALTIFGTLNDRGLPLRDTDVFKAKIYGHKRDDEKDAFIQEWTEIEKDANGAKIEMQTLFTHYMFYMLATNNNKDTSLQSMRKYYFANNNQWLFEENLMNNLRIILNFWQVINTDQNILDETWDEDKKIRTTLDILTSYPSEWWKYPVVIYYLKYHKDAEFNENFLHFIRCLTSILIKKYIEVPSLNHVKGDILKLNVNILSSPRPRFEFSPLDPDINRLKKGIYSPHNKLSTMLLKFYAYTHPKQEDLLPNKWQIEHILPQKNDEDNQDVVKEMINHIGNLTPLEGRYNKRASNCIFGEKKRRTYPQSHISVTKELEDIEGEHFTTEKIKERDEKVCTHIIHYLDKWQE